MIYDVFISYSHLDSADADEVCTLLDSMGVSYYIDSHGIDGGNYFSANIANAISHCNVFLLLISANSMASEYVSKELHYFVQHKLSSASLLPYRLDKSILKREWELVLSDVHYRSKYKEPISPYLIHDILAHLGHPIPLQFAIHSGTKPDKLRWRYDGHGISAGHGGLHEQKELPVAEIVSGVDVVNVDTNDADAGRQRFPKWMVTTLGMIVILLVVVIGCIINDSITGDDDANEDDTTVEGAIVAVEEAFAEAEECLLYGNFDAAIERYEALCEVDSLRAFCELGRCYLYKSYEGRNDTIALSYFLRAAEGGAARGYFELAQCSMKGVAGVPDTTMAFNRYRKSAEMGYPHAARMVARCFEMGYEVNPDSEEADYWNNVADSLTAQEKNRMVAIRESQN